MIFEKISSLGHEEVLFCSDTSCGLKAIVAIHDTTLGPALGGTRLWDYKNEDEALEDVLRLSRGMTYKAALAGLHLGGGKAVIIGNPQKIKSEALFRSFGRFINSLNGRYITAEDVNINVDDIEHILNETDYVVGTSFTRGGSGNPATYTALGVFRGIEAACMHVYNDKLLQGKVVAIQGVGSVGMGLAEHLTASNAKIYFTDINQANIEKFHQRFPQATQVAPEEIFDVSADIFSPCALGAILNEKNINRLKCKIIAGAANNQLADTRDGFLIREKGITYVPDYLINAGGVINVSLEFEGWSKEKALHKVDKLYQVTLDLLKKAQREGIPTHVAADYLAEERIRSMRNVKLMKKDFSGRMKR